MMGWDFSTAFVGAYAIFLLLSLGVLIVLWIAMPFSVFGIKELLRECIKEQRKIKEILNNIVERNLPWETERETGRETEREAEEASEPDE
jgi:hypothetical protein